MSLPPPDLHPWSTAYEGPPFLPGCTRRPAPLNWPAQEPGGACSPDLVADEAWRRSPAYLVGWRCYSAGRFWEAHEAWESAWQASRRAGLEPQAAHLRCLIQVAAAALKLRLGQPETARVLLARAEQNARAAGNDAQLGIKLESWLARWRSLLSSPHADWRARPAGPIVLASA